MHLFAVSMWMKFMTSLISQCLMSCSLVVLMILYLYVKCFGCDYYVYIVGNCYLVCGATGQDFLLNIHLTSTGGDPHALVTSSHAHAFTHVLLSGSSC